jgi:hypothetical protein
MGNGNGEVAQDRIASRMGLLQAVNARSPQEPTA